MITLKEKFALGIDIGGTKLRIGLVNEKFELVDFFITQEHKSFYPQELVDFTLKNIHTLIDNHANIDIVGVGVGYPGPIHFNQGCTFSYSNLRDKRWERVSLARMIAEKTNLPVLVDNDANLAGLAEVRLGAGRDFLNLVYLTISTGTGGAIFFNRQIYRGFLGSAGEFGHMVIDLHGPECKCGNTGCLMSSLSGLGIEKLIREEPLCRSLFSEEEKSDDCIRRLIELSALGDGLALKVVKPLVDYLSVAFLNVIHILNPEAIVVGGGLGNALINLFLDTVKQYLRAHLPKEVIDQTQIKEAELGDKNGVLGGAILVFDSFKENQKK